jgi:hypothetical protein
MPVEKKKLACFPRWLACTKGTTEQQPIDRYGHPHDQQGRNRHSLRLMRDLSEFFQAHYL